MLFRSASFYGDKNMLVQALYRLMTLYDLWDAPLIINHKLFQKELYRQITDLVAIGHKYLNLPSLLTQEHQRDYQRYCFDEAQKVLALAFASFQRIQQGVSFQETATRQEFLKEAGDAVVDLTKHFIRTVSHPKVENPDPDWIKKSKEWSRALSHFKPMGSSAISQGPAAASSAIFCMLCPVFHLGAVIVFDYALIQSIIFFIIFIVGFTLTIKAWIKEVQQNKRVKVLSDPQAEDISVAVINRPTYDIPNALDTSTLLRLGEVILANEQNDKITATLIMGKGDRAFVAGGDLIKVGLMKTLKQAAGYARLGLETMNIIARSLKPVVVLINGPCSGGGSHLALAGDRIIMARTFQKRFKNFLQHPEVTLNVMPAWGGLMRLSQRIGPKNAICLFLEMDEQGRTRRVYSEEALAMGLVDEVVEEGELFSAGLKAVRKGIALSQNDLRFTDQKKFLAQQEEVQGLLGDEEVIDWIAAHEKKGRGDLARGVVKIVQIGYAQGISAADEETIKLSAWAFFSSEAKAAIVEKVKELKDRREKGVEKKDRISSSLKNQKECQALIGQIADVLQLEKSDEYDFGEKPLAFGGNEYIFQSLSRKSGKPVVRLGWGHNGMGRFQQDQYWGSCLVQVGQLVFMDAQMFKELSQSFQEVLRNNIILCRDLHDSTIDNKGLRDYTSAVMAAMFQVDFEGKWVIDFGSGDGMLSLAAQVFDPAFITLLDCDEDALRRAAVHSGLNSLKRSLGPTFLKADLRKPKEMMSMLKAQNAHLPIIILANLGESEYWYDGITNQTVIKLLPAIEHFTGCQISDVAFGGYISAYDIYTQGLPEKAIRDDQELLKRTAGFTVCPEVGSTDLTFGPGAWRAKRNGLCSSVIMAVGITGLAAALAGFGAEHLHELLVFAQQINGPGLSFIEGPGSALALAGAPLQEFLAAVNPTICRSASETEAAQTKKWLDSMAADELLTVIGLQKGNVFKEPQDTLNKLKIVSIRTPRRRQHNLPSVDVLSQRISSSAIIKIRDAKDVLNFGGKAANSSKVIELGKRVPDGFVLPDEIFDDSVMPEIDAILHDLAVDVETPETIFAISQKISELVVSRDFPAQLQDDIIQAYRIFKNGRKDLRVAVRTSGIKEDCCAAAFAGK